MNQQVFFFDLEKCVSKKDIKRQPVHVEIGYL